MKNVFNFSSGYRPFCSYWWKHYFKACTYTKPLLWSYQRVTRGWADCDVWSLDDYLNNWLPDALEQLKHGVGHPSEFADEKSWQDILDRMIEGFRANARILGFEEQTTDRKADLKLWKDGMRLFVKYYNHLWD